MPPKVAKLVTSGFLFTINTNQSDERYRQPLMDAVDGFLTNLEQFLKHVPAAGELFDPDFTDKLVSADLEPQIEKSEAADARNRSLHCHIVMKIQHRTRIQLNTKKSADYFRQALGLSFTPHVDVKFIKDNFAAARAYVRKTLSEGGEELPLPVST